VKLLGIRQRIKIGDTIIESKELPWDTIKDLAKSLKLVARWDPENKQWILTWRIFSRLDEFLNFLNKKLIYVDQAYAYQILDAIEDIIESVPRIEVDDFGYVNILPVGYDPYEILKKVDRDILPIRVQRKKKMIERIGEIDVMYIAIGSNAIMRIINSEYFSKIPIEIRDLIFEASKVVTKMPIVVKPSKRKRVKVLIPTGINSDLLTRLKNLGTIQYYYESPEGALEEKVIEAYRIYDKKTSIHVYLPAFAIAFIEDILKNLGLDYKIDYGVPIKRIDIQEQLSLYSFQKEALSRWIENNYKGTIVIPTGGGKTIIGIAAIAKLKYPAIIFVPNLWLLEQWKEKISKFTNFSKYAIGTLGGGKQEIRDITIATYQSGIKHIEKIYDKFWLVIFDECHHIPARTFRKISMNMLSPYRLALSATPRRRDKNESLIFKLVGKIVYATSYSKLVKMGFLAPMVYRRILVPMPPDKMLLYQQLSIEAQRTKDPIKKRTILNKMINLCQENPNKIIVIKKILNIHQDKKAFIFVSSIKYANAIARSLREHIPIEALTSELSRREQEQIIKKFKIGIIRALVIIKKAEEGVDIGDASLAIIAGGSKQPRETIQRIGRVLRPGKNKLAWIYEIVSKNTIEESIATKRRIIKIISKISDYIQQKYGIKPIEIIDKH